MWKFWQKYEKGRATVNVVSQIDLSFSYFLPFFFHLGKFCKKCSRCLEANFGLVKLKIWSEKEQSLLCHLTAFMRHLKCLIKIQLKLLWLKNLYSLKTGIVK